MLVPHEHGAYGQLLVPLATGLAIGAPGLAPVGLALGCVLVFLAHEPLLILLGHRGARATRDDGPLARRQIAWMAIGALLIGGGAALQAPAIAQRALLVPATLALVHLVLIARQLERSIPGEIAAAITLSSCALPVALAGGAPVRSALTCWLVFATGLALATLAVRAVIGRIRGTNGPALSRIAALAAAAVLAGSLTLAARLAIPAAATIALVPVSAMSIGLALLSPHPRHLRTIGWSLLSTSIFSAATLIVGL